MKISNDLAIIYGASQEQKAENKAKGDEAQLPMGNISVAKNTDSPLPPEIRQVLENVYGKDVHIDKDAVQALKAYADKFPGDTDEKIQVIKALLGKELDININNLKLLHEALFGRNMTDLIKDMGMSSYTGIKKEEGMDMVSLAQEIKSLIIEGASVEKICDLLESGLEAVNISAKSEGMLQKAVNEGRQTVSYKMEDLGQKIILKALKDAVENEAEETVPNAQHKAEGSVLDTESIIYKEAEDEYIRSVLGAAGSGSKEYQVVEITARMKNASQGFKVFKRDAASNLDIAVRCIRESGASNIQNAKASLQKTIDSLDRIILKSDIALFADMKLEKELVKADSALQKAKQLLDRGEYDNAWKLADKVRNTIESLNWKPSNTRIVHFSGLKEGFMESRNSEDRLKTALKGLEEKFTKEDFSPRKVYEAIRLLGADHEGETARFLAGENLDEEDLHNNVKSLLLKLSEKGNPMSELSQKITGTQLLNRTDNGPLQTMFLALPILINGSMSDMKVYINSKKDEKKLDWQNCSIFFLINTRNLGDTGILLQASGGNLNITVKNDREGLKERFEPLLQNFKENLKELGYEVGSIGFTRLSPKESKVGTISGFQPKADIKRVNTLKKGFDIKI